MTTRKMILKRCGAYLAHVIKGKKDDIQLSNIPILREFSEVFLDELSGVPLGELPSTSPVAQPSYRMTPAEVVEFKIQLQELLDKGFIHPSNSP
jgi:hypothetical protein